MKVSERMKSKLEESSGRQMSLDTEEAMRRMEGVKMNDEWQDDEYSRQRLQGLKKGELVKETSKDGEESFYKRPVPKVGILGETVFMRMSVLTPKLNSDSLD